MIGDYVRQLVSYRVKEIDVVAKVLQHRDRQKPLRQYDQIYMLAGSQLLQIMLVQHYFRGKRMVFVGDGDCVSLTIAALASAGLIEAPAKITVLDFDKRLLKYLNSQLAEYDWHPDKFQCVPYNVVEPIPADLIEQADIFYTNPPYGYHNRGLSGQIFIGRCMELCAAKNSRGVAILPYDHDASKPVNAMRGIQEFITKHGYVISEMLVGLHSYDLDDRPNLLSSTVVLDRVEEVDHSLKGKTIDASTLKNFYGKEDFDIPRYIGEDGQPEPW